MGSVDVGIQQQSRHEQRILRARGDSPSGRANRTKDARRSRTRPLALVLLVTLLAGCSDCGGMSEPKVPYSSKPSLGELVYRIIKARLGTSDQCSNEYVAALEQNHEDFVTTFDYVIETGVPDDFPELLGGTIKPFVDDDRLPRLVDTLAKTVALLVSDEFDPERKTLTSMVNLAEAQTLIESSVAIQLVSAILVDDTIQDKVHALAVIAQEDDGVTFVLDDIMDVVRSAIEPDETPSTCNGIEAPSVQDTLLRTEGFVENPAHALGSPFYLVRPDANGNPAVLSDGGVLRGPFVDADQDLVADVNAEGEPIDASGMPVDLPMIGEDGALGRDEFGRAVDAEGRLIYDYYDTKRTAVSYTMQIGADLFAAGIHHEVPAIVNAALGIPQVCDDGANCRRYRSSDNVVANMVWLLLESAEYTRITVLMQTFANLVESDPAKSEQLLVAIGDVIRALDGTTLSLVDTEFTGGVRDLVPLLAQLFATPNTGGKPTARLLVDFFQSLGDRVDTIPANMRYSLVNQFDPDASGGRETVDWSQPRFPATGPKAGDDNRSGLEQVFELFEYADCGYVGPATVDPTTYLRGIVWTLLNTIDGGNLHPGTFTMVLVEFLSHRTPDTVSLLGDLVDGIQDLVGSNTLAWLIQNSTGGGGHASCSGADAQKTAEHMAAVKFLADAGGLDWILPIADIFNQQGQLRLLVDIANQLALELRRDEDNNPSTSSALRRLGPAVLQLVTPMTGRPATETPMNTILDTFDLFLTIPASDGNGTALDVVVDAAAYFTATRTITTRPIGGGNSGTTSNSIAWLLLDDFVTLQTRVASGGAADELSRLADGITPLLTRTTGSGASRRLANPNLRQILATSASVLADALALPTQDYLCYVHEIQSGSASIFDSKDFATTVRVLAHLASSPNAAALESWIVSMLRGQEDRSTEVYGRVMQLAAGALSSDASGDDLSQILAWLSAGLEGEDDGALREIVRTLDELLATDEERAILTMMRSLIAPGPLESLERPVSTYARVASDVNAVDPGNSCMATGREIDVPAMSDTVEGLVDFLTRDPDDGRSSGIEQVWDLVGAIAPDE